jgi:gluconokinase
MTQLPKNLPKIIVVMGVSGAGKSAVGQALATRLGYRFLDADDFHTQSNIAKMRTGQALNSHDRQPWYRLLNQRLRQAQSNGEAVVLACSALTQQYRVWLSAGVANQFIYLAVDEATLQARLAQRHDHFMSSTLLGSQLATLEAPALAEALVVEVGGDMTVEMVVEMVVEKLNLAC